MKPTIVLLFKCAVHFIQRSTAFHIAHESVACVTLSVDIKGVLSSVSCSS